MADPIVNTLGIVGMKHRGAYDSSTNYEKLNVVTYQGSSYCAKGNTVGNLPTNTTYWDLLAQKGATGETGDTGPQGPKPVKGVDYYTDEDIADLEETLSDDVTTEVTSQLSNLTSAAPLVASSVAGMTDTTRIYVLTTDGHWYWYNGSTWVDGGTYQAAEDSGSVNYLLDYSLVSTSIELLNYKDITLNKLINDNAGTLSDNTSYNTSDYIYCEAGVTYKITGQARRFLGYNLDKTPIASTYQSSNQIDYEYTPVENGYFRFSFTNTQFNIKVNKIDDVENNKIEPQKIVKNNVLLNDYQLNQLDKKFYLSKMLNNFSENFNQITLTWTSGKFINSNTLEEESNLNAKYTSYTIDNSNLNNIYKIIGHSYGAVKPYIFIDSYGNMEFEPYSNVTDEVDTLFIPKSTGTLYINSYANYDDTKLLVLSNLTLNISTSDILNNKKYVACGDSFTAGDFQYSDEDYTFDSGNYSGENKVYPYIIGDRCNMNVVNMANGGMTISSSRPTNSFTSLELYKQIPNDANYITLKFGINDAGTSTPIGTIDDETIDTFYGAWNVVMSYIIEHYPNARIGIIITNGLEGAINYVTATINVAKKYGIPYLNEANDENQPLLLRSSRTDVSSSIKTLRNNNFRVAPNSTYPDNTNMHPNVKCHYVESEMVEAFLRRI